jgi:hypothetical protein
MGAVSQQLRMAAETLQLEGGTPQDAFAAAAGAVFVLSFGTDAVAVPPDLTPIIPRSSRISRKSTRTKAR